jgi:uncharacterized phage protein gp47/JayE
MSDILDGDGLTLKTLPEIVTELGDGLKAIYGDDINIGSDTPDGQLINIVAQEAIDLREVLRDVNSSFDPDQAQGAVLDQRVAINGTKRRGATFTIQPISITVDRSVTLSGLDASADLIEIPAGVYTVKDDAGNQFVLLATVTVAAGTHSLSFRASNIGAVQTTINTITIPVTAIAGVTAINNTSGVTTQGVDEESDAALRLRRQRSIAGSSQGYTDSLEAKILSLDDVSACNVEENTTAVTDSNGIPPHSVWCVVENGSNADIAEAIYEKKSAGCGTKGSVSVTVTRVNGRTVVMKFDRPVLINLYIRATLAVPSGGSIDTDYLKAQIVANITYLIGEDATSDEIVCFLKNLNPLYRITLAGISTNGSTWFEYIAAASIQNKFVLDATRITLTV